MNVALPLTNRTVLRPVVETLAGSAELSNQGHSGHEQRATLLSHALTVKRAAIFPSEAVRQPDGMFSVNPNADVVGQTDAIVWLACILGSRMSLTHRTHSSLSFGRKVIV